jgi:hypothetical protein
MGKKGFILCVCQGTCPSPLDVHLPENKHFIADFGLRANDLVVVREKARENPTWERIPELWELAADPEQLSHHLKGVVDRFLGKVI